MTDEWCGQAELVRKFERDRVIGVDGLMAIGYLRTLIISPVFRAKLS
jgi:hypothetical protein